MDSLSQKPGPDSDSHLSQGERRAGRVRRVLVVDDDDGVRDVTVRLLEFEGIAATSAASGKEAITLLGADPFDCVILDLTMPGYSGPDTLKLLREQHPTLPVVLSSGHKADEVDDLLAKYAAAFLAKPFTPKRLLEAITRACRA